MPSSVEASAPGQWSSFFPILWPRQTLWLDNNVNGRCPYSVISQCSLKAVLLIQHLLVNRTLISDVSLISAVTHSTVDAVHDFLARHREGEFRCRRCGTRPTFRCITNSPDIYKCHRDIRCTELRALSTAYSDQLRLTITASTISIQYVPKRLTHILSA